MGMRDWLMTPETVASVLADTDDQPVFSKEAFLLVGQRVKGYLTPEALREYEAQVQQALQYYHREEVPE